MLTMKRVWSLERAVEALGVELVDFHSEHVPAGCHGWSRHCETRGRSILAINPDTHLPHELVAFHELAHIVLGHGKMPKFLAIAAYADCEVQAMKVTLALGEVLLRESLHEWRDEVVDYIAGYEPARMIPASPWEPQMLSEAAHAIHQAGLVKAEELAA